MVVAAVLMAGTGRVGCRAAVSSVPSDRAARLTRPWLTPTSMAVSEGIVARCRRGLIVSPGWHALQLCTPLPPTISGRLERANE